MPVWPDARHANHAKKKDGTRADHTDRIGTALSTIVLVVSCVACIVLSLLSLCSTAILQAQASTSQSPITVYFTENMIVYKGAPSLKFLLGIIIITGAYLILAKAVSALPTRCVGRTLVLFSLSIALIWVLAFNVNGTYWYNDAQTLLGSSQSFLEHDYFQFSPDSPAHRTGSPEYDVYYSWYPFQTGAMLWFAFVFSIVGVGNIVGFQIINAFMICGIVWSVWKLGKLCGLSDAAQRIEALLLMTCFPLLMVAPLVYTNSAGLFFVLLAVIVGLYAMRQESPLRKALLAVAAFLIAAVAMMVKGTVIIFVLALLIVLVIEAVIHHLWWHIPLYCVLFLAAHQLSGMSVTIVEAVTGQHFGSGMPQLFWIAIGLNPQSFDGNVPGWWSDIAINAYTETHGDTAQQSAIARQYIADSLTTFIQNPAEGWTFFVNKLSSEWAEPTFQSLHYSQLSENIHPADFVVELYQGTAHDVLIGFENIYQSLIYIFATVGVIILLIKRKAMRNNVSVFLTNTYVALVFLGGFVCFLFWEAKGIYTLPFLVMLIPLAAQGMDRLYQTAGSGFGILSSHMRNRTQQTV